MLKASYAVARQVGVSIKMASCKACVKDVLFSSLTGDFDDSELSDGEQSQVCFHHLSLLTYSISMLYVVQYVFKQSCFKKKLSLKNLMDNC